MTTKKRPPWSPERRAKFLVTISKRPRKAVVLKPVKLKKDGTPRKVNECGPRIKPPKGPNRPCRKCTCFQLGCKSELTGEVAGTCHAHPPSYEMGRGVFPPVHGDDWCKEFK